jgi:hypothetical protein
MTDPDERTRSTISRRRALQVLAAGAGAAATLPALSCRPGDEAERSGSRPDGDRAAPAGGPAGTSTDPDLINPVKPWGGTLTEEEMRTAAALCDVIIPADDHSPSASAVGAHEFIDEWVSAPYEANQNDRVVIRGGLAWLNVESVRRFGSEFALLDATQRYEICADIHYVPDAAAEYRSAARFFDKMRDLTATAFYTTEEGMADLQYIGNIALDRFDGPPPEVLERLGLP